VLRATYRVLRAGGRVAFLTLHVAPDIAEPEYRRLLRKRASGVSHRKREYRDLLAAAGFVDISQTDVSADFADVRRRWLQARERHADALRKRDGVRAYNAYQKKEWAEVETIEAGLLRRSLFVARRPEREVVSSQ